MTQSTVIRNGVGAKVSREAEFRERSLKHYLEVQNARNAVHAYKKKVASTKGASKSKIVKRSIDEAVDQSAEDFILGTNINPNQPDDAVSIEGQEKLKRFKKETRLGAKVKDDEARFLKEDIRDQGIKSTAQDRWVVVHKEHAKSIAGEKVEETIASPTQYGDWKEGGEKQSFIERGSNSPRSQFSGSGRYNVRLGQTDSYTKEQMQRLGRPSTGLESAVDFELKETFGTINKETGARELGEMIEITPREWRLLQQGKITDDQLISHKFAIQDAEKQGYIWMDADFDDDDIIQLDTEGARRSLQKHWKDDVVESSTVEARAKKFKRPPTKTTLTKLPSQALEATSKAAGRLGKAEALARLGIHVGTGNLAGALVSTAALGTNMALQTPAVQKKVLGLAARMVAHRGAKSAAKLIPGVDIGIYAGEALDYARQGRLDQASLSAIGAAVGWIPGAGDLAGALIDITNTAVDYSRGDFTTAADKQKKPQSGEIVSVRKKQKPLTEADIKMANTLKAQENFNLRKTIRRAL